MTTTTIRWTLTTLGMTALTVGALAAQSSTAGPLLAIDQTTPTSQASLTIDSSAFRDGQSLPQTFSDYGDKVSPPLRWSGVPPGARALVLMMEDPDAAEPKPFVHWMLYNLPADQAVLDESVSPLPRLPQYQGALQGRNSKGSIGYAGPHPPKADRAHHYHIELFALDQVLSLAPSVDRGELLTAMSGHVIATGQIVGLFKAPEDAK
jgi:Raf kinase inhibitor-like YbhB/YbcL family protein